MKKHFVFIVTSLAILIPSTSHAEKKYIDFSGVLQCRSLEDNDQRLSCYDKSILPTKTQTAEKFDSREQCPEEESNEKRLICYDRFFSPTFKVKSNDTTKLPALNSVEVKDRTDTLRCQSETNGTKRLACYDEIFPQEITKKSDITEDKPAENTGKWMSHITTSPVDDSKNVLLMLSSNNSVVTQFGERVTPEIFITCREKKTEVFINWDMYLGLDETSMLYRLDKQKAVERSWSISTDTKAVFYTGRNIDFIRTLMKADKMFVKITPYNANPESATFDLSGLDVAIKPLQQACSWK